MNKNDDARERLMRAVDGSISWARTADTSTLICNLAGKPCGGARTMAAGPRDTRVVVRLPDGIVIEHNAFIEIVAREIDRRMPRMEDA